MKIPFIIRCNMISVKDSDETSLHWKEVEASRYPKRRLGKREAVKLACWLAGITIVVVAMWAYSAKSDHSLVSLGWGVFVFSGFYLMPIVHYLKLE